MHLEYGKTRLIATGSKSMTQQFSVGADRVSLALFIPDLTGTLSVSVWTSDIDSPSQLVTQFDVQTGPTTSYLTLLSPILVTSVRLVIDLTGTGSFLVYGKAVAGVGAADSGESSAGAGSLTHQALDELILGDGAEVTMGDGTELAVAVVGQDRSMQIPASNQLILE